MFSAALISGLKEESAGLKGGMNNKKTLYSVFKTNKQTNKNPNPDLESGKQGAHSGWADTMTTVKQKDYLILIYLFKRDNAV